MYLAYRQLATNSDFRICVIPVYIRRDDFSEQLQYAFGEDSRESSGCKTVVNIEVFQLEHLGFWAVQSGSMLHWDPLITSTDILEPIHFITSMTWGGEESWNNEIKYEKNLVI